MSESHMYAPMKMTFYGINVHIHQKGLHEKGFYLLLIKKKSTAPGTLFGVITLFTSRGCVRKRFICFFILFY